MVSIKALVFYNSGIFFFFCQEDNCFTILCWFLPYINMSQPQVCVCPFLIKKKYFWLYHAACGILVPQPGIEPTPPALEVQSLNRTGPRGEPLSSQFALTLVFFTGGSCKARDLGSIPGSGRFPGEGNGNPLQYSCLENLMDGEAWCRLQSMGSQRVRHD